jgi:hypothetical protein
LSVDIVQNGSGKEAAATVTAAAAASADHEVMWEFKWKNDEGDFLHFLLYNTGFLPFYFGVIFMGCHFFVRFFCLCIVRSVVL